ncbi:methyltransferase domain-containing protein [Patescibacteria group bacterium]
MNEIKKDNLKIRLGESKTKKEGWINLDILNTPEVDLVCDLNKRIPLDDNSVIKVKANHILEHLDDTTKIMEELWRVCKPNAKILIKVPHYASINAHKDPTHKSFFTEHTFEYFLPKDKKILLNLPNYLSKAEFDIEYIGYIWSSKLIRFLPFKSFLRKHFWNIARTIIIQLRVRK